MSCLGVSPEPARRGVRAGAIPVLLVFLVTLLPWCVGAQESARSAAPPPPPPPSEAAGGDGEQSPAPPPSDADKGFWATFAHTTPSGLSTKTPSEAGVWGRTLDGMKLIFSQGRPTLLVSGYAWHLPWKHKTERQKGFNDAAWGGGFAWSYGENDRRERTLYFVANNDSHEHMQYMAGYVWLARWKPYGTLRLGAGYSLFLIGRNEYYYIPGPLILPAFSVGTDPVDVYATYVPYGEVVLFVGRVRF